MESGFGHSENGGERVSAARLPDVLFVKTYMDAGRTLFHGKLLERTSSDGFRPAREWGNVAKHCIDVARGLDALATLLGLPDDGRERIVNVGMLHDWNKRLEKWPGQFTDAEREEAVAYAKGVLKSCDPDGHLLNATEPDGLARLETKDATLLEHCVHFIDLSTMPMGIMPTEKRIASLRERRKEFDNDPRYPRFWDRKEALTEKEEAMFLGLLRARGMDIPVKKRLYQVLAEAMGQGAA